MAVPAAPTAGEPIAEAWGDVVHDAVVAQDVQSGVVTITTTAAPTADATVTFPRPFATGPQVFVQCVGGNVNMAGLVSIPPVGNCTIRVFKRDGTNFGAGQVLTVFWLAYGPRA